MVVVVEVEVEVLGRLGMVFVWLDVMRMKLMGRLFEYWLIEK